MSADPGTTDARPAPGSAPRLPTVTEIHQALEEIADLLEPAAWEQLLAAAELDGCGVPGDELVRSDLDRLLATMTEAWDPLIEMTAREFLVRVEAYDRAQQP